MRIICPKCGEVEIYGILERCHQTLMFNANNEPCGASELVDDWTGKPRCMKCDSMVKFIEEQQGEDL